MRFGVSYFGNRMPWYVEKDLEILKKDGFQIIVHTYSENDFRFYEKTMRDIAQMSKDMGFEIWADPWGWGGIFGGEAFSGFLQHNMDQAQVGNDGKQKGSVCFNSQSFRGYIKQWIDATKEAGFDAIFWDEPHFHIPSPFTDFPSVWTCRCDRCKRLFEEKYGYPMPTEYNEDVANFRNDTVVEFFSDLTKYAKQKDLKNIVCFLPFEMELFGIRDFEQVAKVDFIDNIGTDPYWFAFGLQVNPFVEEAAKKIETLSQKYKKQSHMWLQGFKVPAGREEELFEGYSTIKNHRIDSLLFWGVYACEHISSIAPEDSKRTWQTILRIVSGERK
ncbi:MAG: hypothetical protein WHT65_02575 [Pseudothermotoga sp.]